jgi:hypothetical protein
MNRQTLIQKLKEDIAQGRGVIIAGTGVSIAACGNQLIEIIRSRAGPVCCKTGSNTACLTAWPIKKTLRCWESKSRAIRQIF